MKKILIIRFSSIGDIVLTTPVIRCIKQQQPDTIVHYLTKRSYLPVLEANPYIDKIITINQRVGEVTKELKAEHYDLIIDLHKNTRSFFVKLHLFNVAHVSFDKLNFKKWQLVKLKKDRMPKVHIVDRYLETVRSLGVYNDHKGLDHFIQEHDEVDIKQFPIEHQNGFIAIALGSKHVTKQMPANMIIDICNKLQMSVILMGSQQDNEKASRIIRSIKVPVFNACGIFNINQSASIVQQCRLLITPDTGLMHIAAAYKKKIVSVWGNTVPAFGMYPYLPEVDKDNYVIIENDQLTCRPCSKLGYKKCPEGHFKCMNELDTNLIVSAANELIHSSSH